MNWRKSIPHPHVARSELGGLMGDETMRFNCKCGCQLVITAQCFEYLFYVLISLLCVLMLIGIFV